LYCFNTSKFRNKKGTGITKSTVVVVKLMMNKSACLSGKISLPSMIWLSLSVCIFMGDESLAGLFIFVLQVPIIMINSPYNQHSAILHTIKSLVSSLIAVLVFITLLAIKTDCMAQSAKQYYLLALSKADHTLAIVDPVTFKVIARVPVGPDPHEVIASADGKTAYVSNYAGGSLHELDIIDLVAQKPLPAVDTKPLVGLHGLDFANEKVWFTAEGSKTIGSYDPKSGQVDWAMGTGQGRTHMIYVTPDAKRIYTTNVSSGTVSILVDSLLPPPTSPTGQPFPGAKPHRDWIHTVIPVSVGSEGFDVSPDGRELWTAAASDAVISIIDLTQLKKTDKIESKALGANRLKFTPDGKRVLVTSLSTGDLFIYDAVSHKELKRINTGRGAAGILVDPDGSRAFIGCTADNYVAVIDLKTLQVSGHIDVGGGPDGLAWAVKP
jgi:YVTN family beta-propeller protein